MALRRWGPGPSSRPSAFYWPTGQQRVFPAMTPREAWQALLTGEIDGDTFGRVLRTWDEAWIRVEV